MRTLLRYIPILDAIDVLLRDRIEIRLLAVHGNFPPMYHDEIDMQQYITA